MPKLLPNKPIFPIEKPGASYKGLTVREHFALELTKALLANPYALQCKGVSEILTDGITAADDLIHKLNEGQTYDGVAVRH